MVGSAATTSSDLAYADDNTDGVVAVPDNTCAKWTTEISGVVYVESAAQGGLKRPASRAAGNGRERVRFNDVVANPQVSIEQQGSVIGAANRVPSQWSRLLVQVL